MTQSITNTSTRRDFLKTSAGLATATGVLYPFTFPTQSTAQGSKSPNERPRIGAISLRYQGTVITEKASQYGDVVAVCDVDRHVRDQARASFGSTPKIYENYLDLLQNKSIDVVLIGAPDHWHTKMLIDACKAGKDVYCEKPLTLTIEEGQLIRQAVAETGKVVQVGTWQRSDHRFRLACELVQQGRIGNLKKVTVVLGKNKLGGPFEVTKAPGNINWDLWQGQTPDTPYIAERCHYTFRWWYEYSGGQMTDWGAHHVDIAQWGAGVQNTGPVEISGTAKYPDVKNGFNVAIDFGVKYKYANGVELEILDNGRNGVMFEGDKGRVFVNRGTVSGKPVEDLAKNPLKREDFKLYDFDNLDRPERMGKLDAIVNHMGNFFDCLVARKTPVSSVENQHRSVSVCHLGNIAMRLGRKLKWDPENETFVGDKEANTFLHRDQRKGFEIKV